MFRQCAWLQAATPGAEPVHALHARIAHHVNMRLYRLLHTGNVNVRKKHSAASRFSKHHKLSKAQLPHTCARGPLPAAPPPPPPPPDRRSLSRTTSRGAPLRPHHFTTSTGTLQWCLRTTFVRCMEAACRPA